MLPARMVCTWLGFPRSDGPRLIGWWHAMLERVPMEKRLPPTALEARDAMRLYIKDAMAARRDSPTDDLLSVLVAAVLDGKLSEQEATGVAMLLFLRWHHDDKRAVVGGLHISG